MPLEEIADSLSQSGTVQSTGAMIGDTALIMMHRPLTGIQAILMIPIG